MKCIVVILTENMDLQYKIFESFDPLGDARDFVRAQEDKALIIRFSADNSTGSDDLKIDVDDYT